MSAASPSVKCECRNPGAPWAWRSACLARFWADLGLHTVLSERHRADPHRGAVLQDVRADLGAVLDGRQCAACGGVLQADLWCLFAGGLREPGVWVAGCLGAGALSVPRKKIVDALVDLPFALPTAVAGISLTALLAGNGWVGQFMEPLGIQLAFNPNGIVIALIFIGLPFVVRTVQPVLEDSEKELEEAATSLGASRWQIFYKVLLPTITPALLTGFAMAFARALGEYGSVIFIAGNMPMVSEITPLIIIGKLEQYDYAGATAVAVVMLFFAFIMLLVINGLQAWQRRHSGARI